MKRKAPTTPLVNKGLIDNVQSFKTDVKTLLKTPNGNPLNRKYSIQSSKGEEGGKHGDVFFVNLKNKSSDQTFAVKRQVIKSPKHLSDRSYRELLIFQNLNQLAVENKCVNFVEIIEWFKAMPNIMTPERRGTKQYALQVSQTELDFVHNDLHLKNILLKTLPQDKKYLSMSDQDFGLSKITTRDGKLVHNPKSVYSSTTDIEKLSECLGSIKMENQEAADKSALNSLKKQMRKNISIRQLLGHEYFSSLKERPADSVSGNTINVNSSGQILREVTNTYLTPNHAAVRLNPNVLPVDDVKRELMFSTPINTNQPTIKNEKEEREKEGGEKDTIVATNLTTLFSSSENEDPKSKDRGNKTIEDKSESSSTTTISEKEPLKKLQTQEKEIVAGVESQIRKYNTRQASSLSLSSEMKNEKEEETTQTRKTQLQRRPLKKGDSTIQKEDSETKLKKEDNGIVKRGSSMIKRGDSMIEKLAGEMAELKVTQQQEIKKEGGGELRRSARLKR